MRPTYTFVPTTSPPQGRHRHQSLSLFIDPVSWPPARRRVLADPLRCWIPNPHPCLHESQQLFLELLTEEIERSTTRLRDENRGTGRLYFFCSSAVNCLQFRRSYISLFLRTEGMNW